MLCHLLGGMCPTELPDMSFTLFNKLSSEVLIMKQPHGSLGKRIGIPGWDQNARITRHFRQGGTVAGNRRAIPSHCFDHWKANPFRDV